MANELVIKISGDVKDFKSSLNQVKGETEELNSSLAKIANVSAVAFAGIVAEVGFAVKAFKESEDASRSLAVALGNQGIYSKSLADAYKEQAAELQKLTGIDDDSIVSGQAKMQAYLGQTKITKELTQSVLDFATAQKMDLDSAFNVVGKSIGGSTNMLSRYGIEIDANASKQEKMQAVMEGLSAKFKGQAEAANQGLGGIIGLKSAFSGFQEEIGRRFAPLFEKAISLLTEFFQVMSGKSVIADMGAELLSIGGVLTGLVVILGKLGFAVKGLMGATGIGLIAVVIGDLALNWQTRWELMQAIFQAFIENIGTLGEGLAGILKGIFKFDVDAIKAGLEQAKGAFTEGFTQYKEIRDEQEQVAHEERVAKELERENQLNTNRQIAISKELSDQDILEQKLADIRKRAKDKKVTDKAEEIFKFEDMEKKHGTTLATIDQFLNSDEMKRAQGQFGAMSALQQSENSKLKAMGKAFAIGNIIVNSAKAAMAIFTWFSETVPPPFGQALGVAGAAGAIAFGAEQVGKVTGAAQGGLLTGGIPGIDSIPVMAQQGELISPSANFEEVIGSVRAQREAERMMNQGSLPGVGGSGETTVNLVLTLKDGLMDFVEAQLVERSNIGLSIQGAS